MHFPSRIRALASALVASIAALTFADPQALQQQRRRALESLHSPSPIARPLLHRAGMRLHLKRARRDHFADLRELGGTPATRDEAGVPPVMNRAARRAAARALRYSP